ncbi:hypothetical protein CDV36_016210 [Fusarium kuroshium]|uniref:Uncharacterized protein n=1 Tax=Fusarium kuroshium TaxID=2010991 RepID=A0A3M2QXA9_9HYPO|nr:hypothetical protein CDV36_016210 [Fusarium kuroshium]
MHLHCIPHVYMPLYWHIICKNFSSLLSFFLFLLLLASFVVTSPRPARVNISQATDDTLRTPLQPSDPVHPAEGSLPPQSPDKMPFLMPIGPLAMAATFDHGTLTLRLGIGFPGFYALIYISFSFPPAARPFNIALLLHPANWMQRGWSCYYSCYLTTKYNSIIVILQIPRDLLHFYSTFPCI